MEITLKNIFDWVMKGIVFILVVTIVMGVGGFLYTKYFVEPSYTATAKFYASGNAIPENFLRDYGKDVAPQYIEFLNVKEFYEMVSKELATQTGELVSPDFVGASIRFSAIVNETSSFYVTVTTTDQSLTYNIARALAVTAPQRVQNFENVGALEVISHPVFPNEPSGPDVMRNALFATFLGLVLSVAVVILRETMDNRLRTPEEITEAFGLPLFGVVPEFGENEKKGVR